LPSATVSRLRGHESSAALLSEPQISHIFFFSYIALQSLCSGV